ncbi:MAG: hypothetical protein ACFFEY_10080 [Candidatus Thorarchaeota archaeon]
MTEFVNLKLIFIMKEQPSSSFFYSIEDIASDVYKYYGNYINKFNGDIKPFKSVEKLLKHHLNTTITYSMRLSQIEKLEETRKSAPERLYANKAIYYMKRFNTDHFHLKSLLPKGGCNPKDLETIFNLQEKGIFQTIE